MKKLLIAITAILSFALPSAFADGAKVGETAPQFTLKNAKGTDVSLKNFAGSTVVLEWFNPGCPFVKKFYANGDMQKFQKDAREKGVVWLTINSSAEGKQGHVAQEDADDTMRDLNMQSNEFLLDPTGAVGKFYGARTTPHMFVIDAKGTLAYAGAIDSTPSTRSSDISSSTNYVLAAIEALAANKPIAESDTEPYGCSVKYAE
jgi:peroxiredoxin